MNFWVKRGERKRFAKFKSECVIVLYTFSWTGVTHLSWSETKWTTNYMRWDMPDACFVDGFTIYHCENLPNGSTHRTFIYDQPVKLNLAKDDVLNINLDKLKLTDLIQV